MMPTMDITSIIQTPNGSSSNMSKKLMADHIATATHQDVSFMIGTTAETVFLLLIFAACVVSNSLVFVIFYQKPTFRSLSNRFVLNLAVCDLLYSLLVIPNVMVSVISDGSAVGLWWCRLTKVITILLALSSAFSVLLIAVDRYCAVMNPLHYSMTITGARSSFMIAFIWALALVLSILPMARLQDSNSQAILVQTVTPQSQSDEDNEVVNSVSESRAFSKYDEPYTLTTSCQCWTTVTTLIIGYHRLWYSITVTCLGFVLPLFLLCWIYACMFRAAKQNNDRARRHSVTTNPSELIYQHEALNGNCSMSSGECTPINGSLLQSGFKKTFYRRRSSNASLSLMFFREEGRAAQTGLLVIVTFAFCWFPYFAFIIFEAHPEWTGIPVLSRILAQHLTFIGCALNPFVYVYRNRLIWKDARHVLHCVKRPNMGMNNNPNHRIKNGQFPTQSPLINHHQHPVISNGNNNYQPARAAIHRDFAYLHSYPITNGRLNRSIRSPKLVSAAVDTRTHKIIYELPPPEQLENIELANFIDESKPQPQNISEPVVVISEVDDCDISCNSPCRSRSGSNPLVHQPAVRIYNNAALMDYLQVDKSNVIGSSWSLPNQNIYSDVNQAELDADHFSNCVKFNTNRSVGSSGIDRNHVHSKSAHFTHKNMNNCNNDNCQYTMTVNQSNVLHIYNINNNNNNTVLKPPTTPTATLTMTTGLTTRTSPCFGYRNRSSSAGNNHNLRRGQTTTNHAASANTLLDISQQNHNNDQGTTI